MPRLSLWQQHVARWGSCSRCPLQHCRKNVVLGRGQIPADILFVGEAPGNNEDVLAKPFIGPAGKLLDDMILRAIGDLRYRDKKGEEKEYTLSFTNVVGCIPLDSDNEKVEEPDPTDIRTCSPRLVQFFQICKPRLVVYVGTLAAKWVPKIVECSAPTVQIDHPAYILRMQTMMQKTMAAQRAVVKLRCAVEDLEEDSRQTSSRPAKHEPVRVLTEDEIPF